MNRRIIIGISLAILLAGLVIPLVGEILEVKRGNVPKECRTNARAELSDAQKLLTLYIDIHFTLNGDAGATARTWLNIPIRRLYLRNVLGC